MALFYRRPRFTNPPLDTPFELNRASPQARGLVAWWPMIASRGANVLRDLGGRGLNGAFKGAGEPTWITDAIFGSILLFDGDNDRVTGPTPVSGLTQATFSIWIYQLNAGSLYGGWLSCKEGHAMGFFLGRSTMGSQFYIASTALQAPDSISYNAWYHIVGTFQGLTYMRIFTNGIGIAETTASIPTVIPNHSEYNIGGTEGSQPLPAACRVYDARIYNVALSPAVIWQMWDPASRWELYAPVVRWWTLGTPAGAVRILPQLAILGGQSVPSISPHVGGLL